MVKVAGVIGAVIGITIAIVFTEVIFPSNDEWPIVFLGGGGAAGWLIGTSLVRRRRERAEGHIAVKH
jgi:hypothetical protein